MTALLLATLAAFSVNVMLLTTHVLSAEVPDENGSGARAGWAARAVLNKQCRRVFRTSQEQRSGPQNESEPMPLRGMLQFVTR
jgi:hypothetical protein